MIFYESKSTHLSCWTGSNITFPPHIHKELELLLITSGEIEVTINSRTHILKEGDISFALPNTIHAYKTCTGNDHMLIIFNGDLLPLHKNTFTSYKSSTDYISGSVVPPEVYTCLQKIYDETQKENNSGVIAGYLYVAVSRLLPLLKLNKIQKDAGGNLIEHILSYIQSNYLNPLTLSSIAADLDISPFHLSRVFSGNIGLRLDKYINELRVNYANHLLWSTDKPITDIAFECGFDTLRTFNRAYRDIMSVTPREYRKNTRSSHI